MNEKNIFSRHQSASVTASSLLEKIENVCEQLNSCDTADEMTETAGSVLGDVASLSGLASLLLIDIDALIKSDK